ncbi:SRPBCC family protein [Modestobacter sp. NPDC049651]|uniref:SRPBCC family protein n=1 Tax=unclassified Modestobacter TaxID=2643866 RepID=UPI0034035EB1
MDTFEHAAETGTSPAAIWQLWQDVPGWQHWNPGVASATVDGPFATGSTVAMTLPDREVVVLTLETVEPGARFVDTATVDGLVVRTEHRIEPGTAPGRHRVVYSLTVTGAAPGDVLEEVGRAVSGDFPDVLASLLAAADRAPVR